MYEFVINYEMLWLVLAALILGFSFGILVGQWYEQNWWRVQNWKSTWRRRKVKP